MLTQRDIRVINACKNALLKQLHPVVFQNGYGADAVPKASVLSLQVLINEDDIDLTNEPTQVVDECIIQSYPQAIELAKSFWKENRKDDACRTLAAVGKTCGVGIDEALGFCQRNFPPPGT